MTRRPGNRGGHGWAVEGAMRGTLFAVVVCGLAFGPPPHLLSAGQAWAAGCHLATLCVGVWLVVRLKGRGPRPLAVGAWLFFWAGGVLMHALAASPQLIEHARWVLIGRDSGMAFLPLAALAGARWVLALVDARDRTIAALQRSLASDPADHRRELQMSLNDLRDLR